MIVEGQVFPFGEPLCEVKQEDRTPKDVFVLGVYASAVHARWVGPDDKTRVAALAIASEPRIFWEGEAEESQKIIDKINSRWICLRKTIGWLKPAGTNLNGPSGRALIKRYLEPLRRSRMDTWLCDLVPYSQVNEKQRAAIQDRYKPIAEYQNLPEATIGDVPEKKDFRIPQIEKEFLESGAKVLILLGDEPIRWFLKPQGNSRDRLTDFGKCCEQYGRLHPAKVAGRDIRILPLVHPRQAGGLGSHSSEWSKLHEYWVHEKAARVADEIRGICKK